MLLNLRDDRGGAFSVVRFPVVRDRELDPRRNLPEIPVRLRLLKGTTVPKS